MHPGLRFDKGVRVDGQFIHRADELYVLQFPGCREAEILNGSVVILETLVAGGRDGLDRHPTRQRPAIDIQARNTLGFGVPDLGHDDVMPLAVRQSGHETFLEIRSASQLTLLFLQILE